MIPRLFAIVMVLGALAPAASASLMGVFSAISKVGTTPVYVRVKVPDLEHASTGVAIVGAERIPLTGSGLTGFMGESEETTVTVVPVEGRRPYEVTITNGEAEKTFRLSPKPSSVPYAGTYTLYAPGNLKPPAPDDGEGDGTGTAAPADEEEPPATKERPKLLDGHGIGVMAVSSNGFVRVALHLADGTRLTAGGPFDSLFTLPLAATSDAGVSSFTGTLSFVPTDASDASGLFRWTRTPGHGKGAFRRGFDFYQPVAVSRYKVHDQPLKTDQGPQGRMTLKGGPLTKNTQGPITFDHGQLKSAEFELASGMNLFSGHFSGNLQLPILGISAQAAGIVFPKHNRIYGVAHTRYGSTALTIEADNEHLKD